MYSEKSEQDRSSLGVVLDPTVKIRPSEKLQNYISSNASKILPEEQYLSIGNIKELHMKMKTEEEVYLNDLMEGSEICIPGLVIPPRNSVLEKRIVELKKSLAQKEYDRMTRDVNLAARYRPTESISFQLKQMNSGLIGVFQFVVTVGAAFSFGFMGIEAFMGTSLELAVKLLLGIIFALIVACAELYFLLRTIDFAETAPQESNLARDVALNKSLKCS